MAEGRPEASSREPTGDSGRHWWRRVAWGRHKVLVVVGCVVLALALALGGYVWMLGSRLSHIDVRLHASRSGGTTYLVIGSDSRAGVPAEQHEAVGDEPGDRADLVLFVRVPDDGGPPILLSVPRDLLVLGDDLGLHRLAITWLDGPQTTVDALCDSLGIGADHLVRVDLAGFSEIVDEVGGIDVEIATQIRDTVLNFEMLPGTHHLDGAAALLYVRARHLEQFDGSSWTPVDNQRAEQARAVMLAVSRDAEPSIVDPFGAHQLLFTIADSVGVDEGTGLRDLWRLAGDLRRIDPEADDELTATIVDGPIPFATLDAGAYAALRRAGGGGACRNPQLPEARPPSAR